MTEGLHLDARAAMDAIPDAVVVVDGEGRVVFANARAEGVLGRGRAELVGARLDAWIAEESRAIVREGLERAVGAADARGVPAARDVFGLGDGGERRVFELSFGGVIAFGEVVPGAERGDRAATTPTVVVAVRDVTEARRAAERSAAELVEARAARERLEALLEFAPAFIVGVGLDERIEFINRTLPQYTKKDVIGVHWLSFFPQDRHAEMTRVLRTMYETESMQMYETATPGPDGADVWFASHIAPIRSKGQIVGAVLVSQDVTDKKRAQAELVAGRSMALLGTLAAGVAHEINTPVQYVGDSVRFLQSTAQDLVALLDEIQRLRADASAGRPLDELIRAAVAAEEAADLPYIRENMPIAFDSCIDGLNQVATIVRSLKDFAHPAETRMVAADLNRAIQSALTIATHEYKLVADLQEELGDLPPVTCYPGEISRVVLNIVVNAAHAIQDTRSAGDPRGLITVRTRREGDRALISVSDTGGGIPESVRSRIFDPFFTTKELGRGTGQGLAIAWSTIKERHGGELTFETRVGEGTTFFVRVPIGGKATGAAPIGGGT